MNFRWYAIVNNGTRIWGDFDLNDLNGGTANFCTDGAVLQIGTVVQILKPDPTKKKNYTTPAEDLGKWEVQGVARSTICGCTSRQKLYDLLKLN